jgi:hypothetical protein
MPQNLCVFHVLPFRATPMERYSTKVCTISGIAEYAVRLLSKQDDVQRTAWKSVKFVSKSIRIAECF